METSDEDLAKQYENFHDLNSPRNKILLDFVHNPNKDCYHIIQPYLGSKEYDEPIDLTQSSTKPPKEPEIQFHSVMIPSLQPEIAPRKNQVITRPLENSYFKPKMRRPKMHNPYEMTNRQRQFQCFLKDVIELQATESKQAEILKAAKSLFSKRTRTLYHWMYPNTPKQHIKLAVANSWENLSPQEKQFYISQVLVRFGFPQCNLMVNPQLGGIKELPPLPDTYDNTNNYSARELQTAISSISDGNNSGGFAGGCCTNNSNQDGRRRQGRPLGSKNKKIKCEFTSSASTHKIIPKDFQDDPELSSELEKFAISFDCFK